MRICGAGLWEEARELAREERQQITSIINKYRENVIRSVIEGGLGGQAGAGI